ncbi:hypothetical protein D6C78_10659 [Aureobasidium pullulans]|uniref:Uncharacterized protein n=1 Tax=Aureobasidium pullulans TaxID=5580 RepID=A0A4T0BAD1_AURPU|nr:hypothetical protein D6C78_10659 [Aureobasidium pullulans]
MSANKIVTSKFIKSVTKGRKTIAADHATKIDTWDRTFLAKKPSELTITLKEHPSTSDGKDHFTTVYRDADDNHITARHVYR